MGSKHGLRIEGLKSWAWVRGFWETRVREKGLCGVGVGNGSRVTWSRVWDLGVWEGLGMKAPVVWGEQG